jgi:two-component system chemotaxis response regulator CheV
MSETDTQKKKHEILLETGTNELEVVEFRIHEEYYGINVAKVREIIRGDVTFVPVPNAHPSIPGIINLRGQITPIVNLAKHLGIPSDYDKKASRIIVTEFNQLHAGFWVNEVTRIHRLSWTEVESPAGLIKANSGYATGVVKIEEKVLFLLDFERIASIINPDSGMSDQFVDKYQRKDVDFDRSTRQLIVAEDSSYIAQVLTDCVQKAGYKVRVFKNGHEAWLFF